MVRSMIEGSTPEVFGYFSESAGVAAMFRAKNQIPSQPWNWETGTTGEPYGNAESSRIGAIQ